MTYAFTASVPGADSVWPRLLLACLLSALLHLIIFLVPVNPTGGTPQLVSTIQVRLEDTAESDRETAVTQEEAAAPAPAPLSAEATRPALPASSRRTGFAGTNGGTAPCSSATGSPSPKACW
jgi:hypothetical protein